MLLHFRDTGHPWPAGKCSCISGIPAIHGRKKKNRAAGPRGWGSANWQTRQNFTLTRAK
jgi:hypothetical protein